jgi:hypothetical protein
MKAYGGVKIWLHRDPSSRAREQGLFKATAFKVNTKLLTKYDILAS